ncbi:MAG: peptidoglycan-associated lipoprotein Pal [Desulfuromonadaceae bacterium]|nr:peptidoglycan-associated lipoprotein Pal [Desulfuromonadaceae bacterium]
MLKRVPFYGVSVFIVAALLTAGCAKQEVVRKDEGIAPAPVSRQVEQPQPNTTAATPPAAQITAQTTIAPSVTKSLPAETDQNMSSSKRLQSALDKIYFNFDSAELSVSARSSLSHNANLLMKQPTATIRIEGNCDERGSAEYNLALGERRAKAAKQYLVTLGVESARLSVVSYGNEKPDVRANDEAAWAKNRRDEFVVGTSTTISAN